MQVINFNTILETNKYTVETYQTYLRTKIDNETTIKLEEILVMQISDLNEMNENINFLIDKAKANEIIEILKTFIKT